MSHWITVLPEKLRIEAEPREDCCLAIDLGTTTVAGYLLAKGKEPVCASLQNPQSAFGADVMSRIRLAVRGQQEILTNSIRRCLETLTLTLCREADISPGDIQRICVAGNPAMQQFLLGIPLDNLAKVPSLRCSLRSKPCRQRKFCRSGRMENS